MLHGEAARPDQAKYCLALGKIHRSRIVLMHLLWPNSAQYQSHILNFNPALWDYVRHLPDARLSLQAYRACPLPQGLCQSRRAVAIS